MALFRNAPWLLFFPKQHVVSITKPAFYFSKKIIFMLGLPFDSAQGDSFLLLR
jgi:hypothetical protein